MPHPFSYSESIPNPIPNPILKPIPKLQKREKTQDILPSDATIKINELQDILCFLTFLEFRNRFQNRIRNLRGPKRHRAQLLLTPKEPRSGALNKSEQSAGKE